MYFLLKINEITLKGKNRSFFERILIENIKKKLGNNLDFVKNLGGVFWLKIKTPETNRQLILQNIKTIFGISSILEVQVFEDIESILTNKEIFKENDFNLIVKRGDKNYPLTSIEIANLLKKKLKEKFNLEFNSKSLNVFYLEYRDKKFFFSKEKIKAFGGLPVGSSGSGLVLLSAGFDSPVASFLAMKRGLKLTFLHFHSYPQTSKDSIEKVKKLVEKLNDYNFGSSLYLINILELQKFYYQNIHHKFLVIFYRRSMLRLAEKLAQELKINCLITGENLCQVASQTIQNIETISNGIKVFIFRPLLGFNKSEIIDLAKQIGTYEISVLKGDDCCSLFVPRKVETKAKLNEVLKIEEKLKDKIIELEEKIHKEKEETKFNS
jgi:thiamine biosynthesis protein ThiI